MAIGFPVKDNYLTGDVLTAANMNDLASTVNTLESTQYAAGKNKIINGDFRINQRNFTSITASDFGFDRWKVFFEDGTNTYTTQTFTPGAAPIAGYEGTNFARMVSTGQTLSTAGTWLRQSIEDVRTFSGQTVTVSFFARAATGTPKISIELAQAFGGGGSAQVNTFAGQVTLTTSFVRYSVTVAVPSLSGKTIGINSALVLNMMASAGSNFNARSGSLGIQSNTFDIWGVQVEDGSVATAFQTATGTIQGELAACQRYYYRISSTNSPLGICEMTTTTISGIVVPMAVTMRTSPSLDAASGTNFYVAKVANTSHNISGAFTLDLASPTAVKVFATIGTTATAGNAGFIFLNNASAFMGFSADL